jgi:hypothetical protein
MKRVFLVLTLFTALFLLPGVVHAQLEFPQETKNIEVKEGEVIDHDFFAAGESVTISGIVNGDVYAGAGNILVDGKINGDLMSGAGIITLLGEVTDDVRVGGGNILINGIIGKNLTVVGGSVTISRDAKIGGSILAFVGSLDARGPIGRGANVFAGKALFADQVGGDLKGGMEALVLTDEAQILGDLEYASPAKAEIATGALVSGKTTYKPSEKRQVSMPVVKKVFATNRRLYGVNLLLSFFGFVIAFVLGFVFAKLFPKRVEGINKVLAARFWGSLGVGFLILVLFLPVVILLTITIVGIPLLLLLLPLFGFLVYFAKIFTALYLGNRFLGGSYTKTLFAGLLVYYILKMIPVVSPITTFVFTTTGLGAFALDQKALRQTPKKSPPSKK